MPRLSVEEIIQALNLQPLLLEGGMFNESYRSVDRFPTSCLPARYTHLYAAKPRPFGTAIYYLLTDAPGSFSALHRLPSDEVYHFYLGDPLEMTLLYPDGSSRHVTLGQDLLNGQWLQYSVSSGVWQGSRVAPGGHFSLVGTTMAPGFFPDDYEGGVRETLLAQYPDERERILALTR